MTDKLIKRYIRKTSEILQSGRKNGVYEQTKIRTVKLDSEKI